MAKRPIAVVILFFCLLPLLLSCGKHPEKGASLVFVFPDVGQGDCSLIRTEAGDILIDAGPEASQEKLCRRLKALGVTELKLAVFTHPDEDHIGGADLVLSSFPTERVLTNSEAPDTPSFLAMKSAIEEGGAEWIIGNRGDLFTVGDLTLNLLSVGNGESGANEGSIVLWIRYREIAVFSGGDSGAPTEEELLKTYGAEALKCDLYKVGHHGSYTAGSEAFLKALSPTYAVITCGAGNAYGHPHGEVVSRLEKLGTTVKRTDLSGEITIYSDGECIWDENGKND